MTIGEGGAVPNLWPLSSVLLEWTECGKASLVHCAGREAPERHILHDVCNPPLQNGPQSPLPPKLTPGTHKNLQPTKRNLWSRLDVVSSGSGLVQAWRSSGLPGAQTEARERQRKESWYDRPTLRQGKGLCDIQGQENEVWGCVMLYLIVWMRGRQLSSPLQIEQIHSGAIGSSCNDSVDVCPVSMLNTPVCVLPGMV